MLSPKLPLCSWMTVWMTHVLPPPHFLRLKPHVLGCGDKEKDRHDTGSSNPFTSVEELRRQSIGENGESQHGSPPRRLKSFRRSVRECCVVLRLAQKERAKPSGPLQDVGELCSFSHRLGPRPHHTHTRGYEPKGSHHMMSSREREAQSLEL